MCVLSSFSDFKSAADGGGAGAPPSAELLDGFATPPSSSVLVLVRASPFSPLSKFSSSSS
eukprot:4955129-Prymnesium_polylepis.1